MVRNGRGQTVREEVKVWVRVPCAVGVIFVSAERWSACGSDVDGHMLLSSPLLLLALALALGTGTGENNAAAATTVPVCSEIQLVNFSFQGRCSLCVRTAYCVLGS